MTTSRTPGPGTASTGVRAAAVRPSRGSALLALGLAAATSLASLAAVPSAAAAPSVELSRVVVAAAGGGVSGVAAAAAAVAAAGGTVLDRLPLVGGVSAELPVGSVLAPGLTVVPDREVQLAGDSATPTTGPASPLRATLGLGAPAGEGAGRTIAVVDTGVAPHPDLAGRVTSVDVSGAGAGDGYGHGTFVAGIAAGSGASSGGTYAGVAPGAHVLDVRVADAEGSTNLITVLRGLEVARSRGADVVNLSLSSYSPLPWQIDPLTVALTSLWRSGTVVVVPVGNDGPAAGTVTSPGVAPALLTVGALDEGGTADRSDDTVPDFSARGPAPQGVSKPELVAPGRSVVSLRAPGSVIDTAHPDARVAGGYFTGSGTSFSTAVAAGAAAVLRAERSLSPDQVKVLLAGTAYAADGLLDVDAAGAGGLDLDAARRTPAPAVDGAAGGCQARGNGMKARTCLAGSGASVPGTVGEWTALHRALVRGDAEAAASSWSRMSPKAQAWVASSWSSLPADLREELTAEWAARNWAGDPALWAARNWAARNWAARNWAASSWSARNWAASSRSGSADDWLYGWEARNWAARNWAARNWAASSWSARNWAARNWAGGTWSARNWAADGWAARNWAAVEWGP
jgi:serine protease AprX